MSIINLALTHTIVNHPLYSETIVTVAVTAPASSKINFYWAMAAGNWAVEMSKETGNKLCPYSVFAVEHHKLGYHADKFEQYRQGERGSGGLGGGGGAPAAVAARSLALEGLKMSRMRYIMSGTKAGPPSCSPDDCTPCTSESAK